MSRYKDETQFEKELVDALYNLAGEFYGLKMQDRNGEWYHVGIRVVDRDEKGNSDWIEYTGKQTGGNPERVGKIGFARMYRTFTKFYLTV